MDTMARAAAVLLLAFSSACSDAPEPEPVPVPPPIVDLPCGGLDPCPLYGRAMYLATAGVERPRFLSIDASGVHDPIAIGPSRGAGYGLGEGSLRMLFTTPDRAHVLVQFESLDRSVSIFRLALDGSHAAQPALVARLAAPYANPVRATLSADGQHLAWQDSGDVYVGPVNGSRAPVLVAERPDDTTLESLALGTDAAGGHHVVYTPDNIRVYAARSDGSEAQAPRLLAETPQNQLPIAGVVSGGRALIRDGDLLFAYPLADATGRVRLTPLDRRAGSVVGAVGEQLVLTFISPLGGSTFQHQLGMVALDGSNADNPVYLSAPEFDVRSSMLDGTRVLFSAERSDSMWAVFDLSAENPAGDGRASEWVSERVTVGGVGLSGSVIAVCDHQGGVARVPRYQPQPAPLVELARFPRNSICGLRATTETHAVVYDTSAGHSWAVPLAGGAPEPLPPGLLEIVPDGVASLEVGYRSAAVFDTTDTGTPRRLTVWHDAAIDQARVFATGGSAGDHLVVYHTADPDARWYAAPQAWQASESAQPISPEGAYGTLVGLLERSAIVRESDGSWRERVVAYPLDSAEPAARLLLDSVYGEIVLHEQSGVVAARSGDSLVAAPIAGGEPSVLVADDALIIGTDGRSLFYQQAREILALDLERPDAPPWPLARIDSGEVYAARVLPDKGRILVVIATWIVAGPRPSQVLSIRTDGSDADTMPAFAPDGFLPSWESGVYESATIDISGDREWMLLRADDGVYGVPIDRSREPRLLLADPDAARIGAYAPVGAAAILALDDQLWHVRVDGQAADARVLTSVEPYLQSGGVWSADARWFAYATATIDRATLHAVNTADGRTTVLTPMDFQAEPPIAAIAPGRVLFPSEHAGDRTVYQVPFTAAADRSPTAFTPIDDASEQIIAIIP